MDSFLSEIFPRIYITNPCWKNKTDKRVQRTSIRDIRNFLENNRRNALFFRFTPCELIYFNEVCFGECQLNIETALKLCKGAKGWLVLDEKNLCVFEIGNNVSKFVFLISCVLRYMDFCTDIFSGAQLVLISLNGSEPSSTISKYMHLFEKLIENKIVDRPKEIKQIIVPAIKHFIKNGEPVFTIFNNGVEMSVPDYSLLADSVYFIVHFGNLPVHGDVQVIFYSSNSSIKSPICEINFNTLFVSQGIHRFEKGDVIFYKRSIDLENSFVNFHCDIVMLEGSSEPKNETNLENYCPNMAMSNSNLSRIEQNDRPFLEKNGCFINFDCSKKTASTIRNDLKFIVDEFSDEAHEISSIKIPFKGPKIEFKNAFESQKITNSSNSLFCHKNPHEEKHISMVRENVAQKCLDENKLLKNHQNCGHKNKKWSFLNLLQKKLSLKKSEPENFSVKKIPFERESFSNVKNSADFSKSNESLMVKKPFYLHNICSSNKNSPMRSSSSIYSLVQSHRNNMNASLLELTDRSQSKHTNIRTTSLNFSNKKSPEKSSFQSTRNISNPITDLKGVLNGSGVKISFTQLKVENALKKINTNSNQPNYMQPDNFKSSIKPLSAEKSHRTTNYKNQKNFTQDYATDKKNDLKITTRDFKTLPILEIDDGHRDVTFEAIIEESDYLKNQSKIKCMHDYNKFEQDSRKTELTMGKANKIRQSTVSQFNTNAFKENKNGFKENTNAFEDINAFRENTNAFKENTNSFKENKNIFKKNTDDFKENTAMSAMSHSRNMKHVSKILNKYCENNILFQANFTKMTLENKNRAHNPKEDSCTNQLEGTDSQTEIQKKSTKNEDVHSLTIYQSRNYLYDEKIPSLTQKKIPGNVNDSSSNSNLGKNNSNIGLRDNPVSIKKIAPLEYYTISSTDLTNIKILANHITGKVNSDLLKICGYQTIFKQYVKLLLYVGFSEAECKEKIQNLSQEENKHILKTMSLKDRVATLNPSLALKPSINIILPHSNEVEDRPFALQNSVGTKILALKKISPITEKSSQKNTKKHPALKRGPPKMKRKLEIPAEDPTVIVKRQLHWETLGSVTGTVFETLDAIAIEIDSEKFEEWFCEPMQECIVKKPVATKSIINNDQRIFLASLALKTLEKRNIPIDKIENFILKLGSCSKLEELEAIKRALPTKDEKIQIDTFLMKNRDFCIAQLSLTEQHLVKTRHKAHLQGILDILIFNKKIKEDLGIVEAVLCSSQDIFSKILNSMNLKYIIKVILTIGNAINHKYSINNSRKISKSFKITSINPITEYKGKKDEYLLTQYIFTIINNKKPSVWGIFKEFKNLHKVRYEDYNGIKNNLNEFFSQLNKCIDNLGEIDEDKLNNEIQRDNNERQKNIVYQFKNILNDDYLRLQSIKNAFETLQVSIDDVKQYFGCDNVNEIMKGISELLLKLEIYHTNK